MSRQVSLQASANLTCRASFGDASFDVGSCVGVMAHPHHGHGVERAVQASVAAAVESVSDGVPRRCRYRADAREGRERGLVSDTAEVRPRGDDDGGGDRPYSGFLQQGRGGKNSAAGSWTCKSREFKDRDPPIACSRTQG